MKKKLILVTHQPGGQSTVEAIGFTGGACTAATAAIEAALGQQTHREDKPELWQAEAHLNAECGVRNAE